MITVFTVMMNIRVIRVTAIHTHTYTRIAHANTHAHSLTDMHTHYTHNTHIHTLTHTRTHTYTRTIKSTGDCDYCSGFKQSIWVKGYSGAKRVQGCLWAIRA